MEKYLSDSQKRKIMSHVVNGGYNITTLAKAIGMTRESLSARMNGKVDFSRAEMESISACLEEKPEDIFFA